MTYLIHWVEAFSDIVVNRFSSKDDAITYCETLPGNRAAYAVDNDLDFTRDIFSLSVLVKLYNSWATKPVSKFENRSTAIDRTWALLDTKFSTLPLTTAKTEKDTQMPAWTITITGKKIGIASFATAVEAQASFAAEDPTVTLVTSTDDLTNLTDDILVAVYNRTKPGGKVKSFPNHDDAAAKVFDRLQSIPYAKPMEPTEPTAKGGPDARAPRPTGEGKPVREGSSIANILHAMIAGKSTIDQIASLTGIPADNVKHRIKYVLRVNHGVDNKVDEDGIVTALLPAGFDANTIFAEKKGE